MIFKGTVTIQKVLAGFRRDRILHKYKELF